MMGFKEGDKHYEDTYLHAGTGKTWEQKAQELHKSLESFGMHSFGVPPRQDEDKVKRTIRTRMLGRSSSLASKTCKPWCSWATENTAR